MCLMHEAVARRRFVIEYRSWPGLPHHTSCIVAAGGAGSPSPLPDGHLNSTSTIRFPHLCTISRFSLAAHNRGKPRKKTVRETMATEPGFQTRMYADSARDGRPSCALEWATTGCASRSDRGLA
ncbi:hypothetical protein BCEP27_30708 [Burkholderia cepacia]